MKILNVPIAGLTVALLCGSIAVIAAASPQDRRSPRVPNGLAIAEFQGYESWEVIAVSHGTHLAVILGNPAMIAALKSGIPDNGKAFPDGARMAKIHWTVKRNEAEPGQPQVPDTLHDLDFMVKDGKRFADSGGWGYAEFEYDNPRGEYRPGTTADQPPQSNDAKCGFACHTVVAKRDYVFTYYQKR